MTAAKTGTYPGERYRRIARRRGKQKAIVAVSRTICEIAWMIITGPSVRFSELGPGYYARLDAGRQTRNKIRELERLKPRHEGHPHPLRHSRLTAGTPAHQP